jgi:hypothetical protein
MKGGAISPALFLSPAASSIHLKRSVYELGVRLWQSERYFGLARNDL